ncbi:hypothetical protein [Thiohalorhabdus methylotrophus]|uniref:N-acetylmuramoyl-L-alanine amidase n=1 Tax=Thiohalorhabdus methylotrophus TaxID=3242694 RepID=A0ABV4U1C7_9GAMM
MEIRIPGKQWVAGAARRSGHRLPAALAVLAVLGPGCGTEVTEDEETESVTPVALVTHETDLADYTEQAVNALPREDSEGYRPPDAGEQAAWVEAVARFGEGSIKDAERYLRDRLPAYRAAWIEVPGAERYAVLEPRDAADPGWGRVVADPDGERPLVLEVPHPDFDLHTAAEGTTLFTETDARFLLLAGTHRCANGAASTCDGKTGVCTDDDSSEAFRVSDMAHTVDTPFDLAHRTLMQGASGRIAVSLHGNGRSNSCGGLFLSGGITGSAPPLVDDIAAAIPGTSGLSVDTEDSAASCSLVGSTNVQGRFTNGADAPCTRKADTASGRFVHAEQSLEMREDHAAVLADALKAAVPRR